MDHKLFMKISQIFLVFAERQLLTYLTIQSNKFIFCIFTMKQLLSLLLMLLLALASSIQPLSCNQQSGCPSQTDNLQNQKEKISLWLDCDPGLDDAFAIIYAAHAKDFNLIGVSTSPGNSNLANTARNALDILYNIGRKDVPVFAGSNQLIKGEMKYAEYMHGENGLGGVKLPRSPENATIERNFQKIYHKIIENEGDIIWVNTGSLTNLCILLFSFPEVKNKISKIVMMGGAIGKGNSSPAAEFNIFFDPHAFDDVLRLKKQIPLVMIPLQVTHENLATQDVFDYFKRYQHIPLAKIIYDMLVQFKEMYFEHEKFPFPPIHDPCTLFYILHPEEFNTAEAIIKVDIFSSSYGRTNCYFSNPQNLEGTMQGSNLVTTHFRSQKQTLFWEEMKKIFSEIFSEQIQKTFSQ